MKKSSYNNTFRELQGWRRNLFGVRTRLLVWYFVLTACTALVSIQATRQIYCDAVKAKADASLVKEVDRFKLLANTQNKKVSEIPKNTAALFDKFLSSYAPTKNEYVVTLLNDRFYKASFGFPPDLLQQHPTLMKEWTSATHFIRGGSATDTERIRYVAQPLNIKGDRGTIIAIHDASADYIAGTNAIFLVMQVTLVVLLVFFVVAWVTAGRVLYPLRLVTETAHSITESDMTQRIPVQGSDEIAELTTRFNQMLDRLQFAFDSQQKFLNDASHELRTPITIIQGHLEMLEFQPERQQETIALVMDELERMSRLVNDLLLLAKTERPDFLKLKPEELDWLTEELYLKARSLANRDWRLESKGLSPIMVDRQRLTQAVMNLVQNAVRHTSDGDSITLGSSIKEDCAYIWVRDTGEGIAPEDQKRIFERFVRATKCDRQFEGYGLGLSIVQAIAQAHNGSIELTSRLGHGSTFTIAIPLIPPKETATHEPDSHRRRQSPHHFLFGNRIASPRIHNDNRQ
ncbi:MAG: sensor histidine kinase [Heteroscytonema crispum UTEX LB 1556]